MKGKRLFLSIILIILALQFPIMEAAGAEDSKNPAIPVIAMCHPLKSQIRNMAELFRRDLITLKQLKLMCIYHEDEEKEYAEDNYREARAYVETEKLWWVSFCIIRGRVELKDIYKENAWTEQFREIFAASDGIIFTGGWDLPPELYGEEKMLVSEVYTPSRSYYEASFLFHLLGGSRNSAFKPLLERRKDYGVLGICLGAQTMNVACGGTLYQDFPSQVYGVRTVQGLLARERDEIHSARYIRGLNPQLSDMAPTFHRIRLNPSAKFTGDTSFSPAITPYILSSHHQAIKEMGAGLIAIGASMDGKIIEMIEHNRYANVLGVQFHPEVDTLYAKDAWFREDPRKPATLNLLEFLRENNSSLAFHQVIWKWFSQAVTPKGR